MAETQEVRDKVVLVGLNSPVLKKEENADEDTMEELSALVETAGGETVGIVLQNRPSPDPRTFIGEGKVAEVKELAHAMDADMVIFQRAPVAVEDLVRAALRPFLLSFELHSITLETDLSAGATWMGDRHWLTEALQNLLKNALDSMQDHGCLQIRCEDTLLFTQLTLHDSGPGFAPADLPHLFHRFYRGTGTGNTTGYGIGLSLCKTIITQQGGQITADNHPQGGAVFTIRFPK